MRNPAVPAHIGVVPAKAGTDTPQLKSGLPDFGRLFDDQVGQARLGVIERARRMGPRPRFREDDLLGELEGAPSGLGVNEARERIARDRRLGMLGTPLGPGA